MSNDTGAAKLPGLLKPQVADAGLARWVQAVTEHLEVRAGARGNPAERVVTQRELDKIASSVTYLQSDKREVKPGDVVLDLGGGLTASVAIDRFIDSIKATRLYKDLIKRLDDPSRFDDLPGQVREVLLRSIAQEAAQRGADIQRLDTKIQTSLTSLAMSVEEVTAGVANASAGVRQLAYASAETDRAQAGKLTQIEASLGNYYQDGKPGRALIEEEFKTIADRTDGLRAQYTLKVQAGGAIAGFGLAAEEVDGVPSSAFIIAANKFAIVDPLSYASGLTNTPDPTKIPFGVDANGIYLNSNVYVRGTMRVDTGGKTLVDGLRGSLQVTAAGSSWNDNSARQAIWQALGKSGIASNNNHLVIGDCVTVPGATPVITRQWMGSSWQEAGVVINGNLLVDGSLSAQKIDTRGLTIKDANGNVIFGAGVKLNIANIIGLGSLATQNSVNANNVNGLGGLATQNNVSIGSNVVLPGYGVMQTSDFVNRLSMIDENNIELFMKNAAIGKAYIGNAAIQNAHINNLAVSTLKIADNAVTVPLSASSYPGSSHPAGSLRLNVLSSSWTLMETGFFTAIVFVLGGGGNTNMRVRTRLVRQAGGEQTFFDDATSASGGNTSSAVFVGTLAVPHADVWRIEVDLGNNWSSGSWTCTKVTLLGMGSKK